MCKINVHSIYQHPDWIDKETRAPSILRESKSSTALGQPWPLNITFSSTLCGIKHRYGGSGCRWHYFVIIFVLVISHQYVSEKIRKNFLFARGGFFLKWDPGFTLYHRQIWGHSFVYLGISRKNFVGRTNSILVHSPIRVVRRFWRFYGSIRSFDMERS